MILKSFVVYYKLKYEWLPSSPEVLAIQTSLEFYPVTCPIIVSQQISEAGFGVSAVPEEQLYETTPTLVTYVGSSVAVPVKF